MRLEQFQLQSEETPEIKKEKPYNFTFKNSHFQWSSAYHPIPTTSHNVPAKKNLRKELYPIIHGAYIHKNGDRQPRCTQMLFADFDVLPEGYDSWDDFYEEMKEWYKIDKSVKPFPSVSRKVKVAVMVTQKGICGKEAQRAAVLSVLPDHLHICVDKSPSAISTSYLSDEAVRIIENWLPEAEAIEFEYVPKDKNDYKLLDIEFPEEFKDKYSELELKILHYSSSMYGIEEEAALPQEKLASLIGCSQKTISQTFRKFREDGILLTVDNTYSIKDGIAKTYRIIHPWLRSKIISLRKIITETLPKLIAGMTYKLMPIYAIKTFGKSLTEAAEYCMSRNEGNMTFKECCARLKSLWRNRKERYETS